ncbi:hypothetical protein LINPERPRIM_LOCUS24010, partial [Linum perenne]
MATRRLVIVLLPIPDPRKVSSQMSWIKAVAAATDISREGKINGGLRLPGSKSVAAVSVGSMRCDVVSRKKEEGSSTRCSPTTPFSWTGGGSAKSPSATADGYEETSEGQWLLGRSDWLVTENYRSEAIFQSVVYWIVCFTPFSQGNNYGC